MIVNSGYLILRRNKGKTVTGTAERAIKKPAVLLAGRMEKQFILE
jgi:hypothetical protein